MRWWVSPPTSPLPPADGLLRQYKSSRSEWSFSRQALNSEATQKKWRRVRVTVKQPFPPKDPGETFGLARIVLLSPAPRSKAGEQPARPSQARAPPVSRASVLLGQRSDTTVYKLVRRRWQPALPPPLSPPRPQARAPNPAAMARTAVRRDLPHYRSQSGVAAPDVRSMCPDGVDCAQLDDAAHRKLCAAPPAPARGGGRFPTPAPQISPSAARQAGANKGQGGSQGRARRVWGQEAPDRAPGRAPRIWKQKAPGQRRCPSPRAVGQHDARDEAGRTERIRGCLRLDAGMLRVRARAAGRELYRLGERRPLPTLYGVLRRCRAAGRSVLLRMAIDPHRKSPAHGGRDGSRRSWRVSGRRRGGAAWPQRHRVQRAPRNRQVMGASAAEVPGYLPRRRGACGHQGHQPARRIGRGGRLVPRPHRCAPLFSRRSASGRTSLRRERQRQRRACDCRRCPGAQPRSRCGRAAALACRRRRSGRGQRVDRVGRPCTIRRGR